MTPIRSGVITSGQKSSEIEGLRAIAVAIVVSCFKVFLAELSFFAAASAAAFFSASIFLAASI